MGDTIKSHLFDLKNYEDGIYFVKEVGTLSNNNWKIILSK
jgi:hypothetical protein